MEGIGVTEGQQWVLDRIRRELEKSSMFPSPSQAGQMYPRCSPVWEVHLVELRWACRPQIDWCASVTQFAHL